jgi:Coenzyme PQQ synthesis protein D (PqqD)
MQIERTDSDALVINRLPDGSTVILDAENEAVFALNSTAGAAWDACSNPTTLARVTENMQRSFDPGISEELAEEAILQLHDKKLVTTSGNPSQSSRRQFITTMSSIALPLSCHYLSQSSEHTRKKHHRATQNETPAKARKILNAAPKAGCGRIDFLSASSMRASANCWIVSLMSKSRAQ